jgi:hypothetical protein
VTIPSSNPNPSDDCPPTRPGVVLIAIALGLMAAVLNIENWSDISALAHVPQMGKSLGLYD